MPLDRWLLFCSAVAALCATPGPNVIYYVSRTIVQGRGAGFASLCGTFCGSGLHVLAAALGLSALLVAVPLAYDATRWAGAAYLAWLAFSTWRSRDGTGAVSPPPASPASLVRQGFLTGVLNPKVAVFELALFPQFVVPAEGNVLAQSLLLAATQFAIALVVESSYILLAAHFGQWFMRHPARARTSRRALASVFGLLAVRLAWSGRSAAR